MDQPKVTGSTGAFPQDQVPLQRVILRDPDALDAFFSHFFDRIYAYVVRLLGDPVLGQDLVQESFLRMHQAIERLDPKRDPTPWVFTVVTNTVRDHWRSRQHKSRTREVDLEHVSHVVAQENGHGPDKQLEKKEDAEAIHEALGTLSEADREVILLRDYEGLNSTAVAEMLGITSEAVRQRHSRALARLGEAFRKSLERKKSDR